MTDKNNITLLDFAEVDPEVLQNYAVNVMIKHISKEPINDILKVECEIKEKKRNNIPLNPGEVLTDIAIQKYLSAIKN
tara:strand:+ start:67 stop:300 length:234 start_codon:yes stop_codon:yes gene_type:complete